MKTIACWIDSAQPRLARSIAILGSAFDIYHCIWVPLYQALCKRYNDFRIVIFRVETFFHFPRISTSCISWLVSSLFWHFQVRILILVHSLYRGDVLGFRIESKFSTQIFFKNIVSKYSNLIFFEKIVSKFSSPIFFRNYCIGKFSN